MLASRLLGWRTVGYVEWDRYCGDIIVQRIRDGHLHPAPVWCGDIGEFIRCGAAAEYRGVVDVISAGFPCQPFSMAGKRAGPGDARNQWPATRECIRLVRPRWCFLENVPSLRCPHRSNGQPIDPAYFEEFLETWPISGSMRSGMCFQRPASERLTKGDDSGLLPTPKATPYGSNQSPSSGAKVRPSLEQIAKHQYPTPTAGDAKRGPTTYSRGNPWLLKSVRTPTTTNEEIGGTLNPTWVEWLMGWPLGWTDLEPLATDKFQLWLSAHGGS